VQAVQHYILSKDKL